MLGFASSIPTRGNSMSDNCKKEVSTPGVWSRQHQCTRKATKDGYCKQHHPDTIATKRAAQDAKWNKEGKERQRNNDLLEEAKDPDNVIITRVELQLLISLSSWDGIIRANNEKFLGRMDTKLKEGLEQ